MKVRFALRVRQKTTQIHVRLLNIIQNHNHVRLLNITQIHNSPLTFFRVLFVAIFLSSLVQVLGDYKTENRIIEQSITIIKLKSITIINLNNNENRKT